MIEDLTELKSKIITFYKSGNIAINDAVSIVKMYASESLGYENVDNFKFDYTNFNHQQKMHNALHTAVSFYDKKLGILRLYDKNNNFIRIIEDNEIVCTGGETGETL